MNREDQKPDDNERKMEELRRLLRRLDRTIAGTPAALAAAGVAQDDLWAQPQQLPHFPPLPSSQPREPSESHTAAHETTAPEPKRRAGGPRLAVAVAIAAVAGVGLILGIELPRQDQPAAPSPAEREDKTAKDAAPGLIAAAPSVPVAETPATNTRDPANSPPPAAEQPSTMPSSTPVGAVAVPVAVAEPAPKSAGVEQRTGELGPTVPESSDAAPVSSKSGPDAPPLLAIPPSFMIEAGVTTPFPLRLMRDRWALDGGYLIVSGLPRGSRFSSGTEIVFDTWQIPVSALGDLQLTIPSDGEAELAIELRSAQGQALASTTAVLQGTTASSASQPR
jgi:hypothetical protein